MDANGQRFWMLAADAQWHRSGNPSHVHYDTDRRSLRLASERADVEWPDRQAEALSRLERVPQTLDQFGTRARWSPGAGAVVASGALEGDTPIFVPAAGEVPGDLALGYDGILYLALGGRVVLVDRRNRWAPFVVESAGFVAWRLAPDPGGGVWVLDRVHGSLARVMGQPLPERPWAVPAPSTFRPCEENPDPPRLNVEAAAVIPAGEMVVAIACSPGGRVAVLTWTADGDARVRRLASAGDYAAPVALAGARHPFSIAWISDSEIAVLLASVNEAPAYDLGLAADETLATSAPPLGDLYPLRDHDGGPFVHRPALPPHYALASSTAPLHRLSLPSFARFGEASNRAVIDSESTQTVWHRIYLEASIPPHSAIRVWLATTNERGAPIAESAWHEHRFGHGAVADVADVQITFHGEPAEAFAAAALADPVPLTAANNTLQIVLGGASQTITLPAVDTPRADVVAAINRAIRGGYARLSDANDAAPTNRLVIGSDRRGWQASVSVPANVALGFPAATAALGSANEVPLGAWVSARSELPFHLGLLQCEPVKNRTGLFTALVQRSDRRVRSLRGRFLRIHVELTGDGRSSPEIAALRVYGSRFSYVNQYLPELYRESVFGPDAEQRGPATGPDFLERTLDNFESVLTPLEDRIANAYLLTDARTAPDDALEWLGSWIGVGFDPVYPPERRRQLLRSAPELYKWRGTARGLASALDVSTGGGVSGGEIVVLEDFRLRRTVATILGADLADEEDPLLAGLVASGNSYVGDTLFLGDESRKEFLALFAPGAVRNAAEQAAIDALFDGLAYRVTVLVHQEVEPQDLGLIRRVVELETPAHVLVRVVTATQPFVVGMAALVGVDTYLAPALARRRVEVGRSRVGIRDVLERLPSLDPRLEGPWPAADPTEGPTALLDAPPAVESGDSFILDGRRSSAGPGRRIDRYRWRMLQ